MNTQIIPGSIGSLATNSHKSIAETFSSAEIIIIVDTSGSMSDRDSRGGKTRYEVACEELATLQRNLPGKIAVVGFSSMVQFFPGGIPVFEGGLTDLAKALAYVKIADFPGMRFILISDGEPNEPGAAMAAAKTFKNKIDVVYVGPEDRPSGRSFLQQLAAATGGQTVTADRAKELAASVERLLLC